MPGIIKNMTALALVVAFLSGCKHYAAFPEMEENEGTLISDSENKAYDDSTPIIEGKESQKVQNEEAKSIPEKSKTSSKIKEPEPQKPEVKVVKQEETITAPEAETQKIETSRDLSVPDSEVEDISDNEGVYVVPTKTTPNVITDMDLTEMDAESSGKSIKVATTENKEMPAAKSEKRQAEKEKTSAKLQPSSTEPSVFYLAETVYFNNGSSSVDSKYYSSLRKIVKEAKSHNGRIIVQGFASSRTRNADMMTHKMANLKVSVARAENVANQLAKYGMPRSKIITEGLSDSRPAYQEVMPEGERLNRRAEIYISY